MLHQLHQLQPCAFSQPCPVCLSAQPILGCFSAAAFLTATGLQLVDNALYASQAAVAQRELQVRLQQLAVREKELAVQAQELSLRESRLPVAADPSKLRAAPPPPSLPPQHGENSFYRVSLWFFWLQIRLCMLLLCLCCVLVR